MATSFFITSELMRLRNPTGYLLVFFPALFGLIIAAGNLSDLLYIPLFFFGSVIARGAGCIINDIMDKNLDSQVERTKNRPLAGGIASLRVALINLMILLSVCLAILLTLSKTAIIIGIIAFFMILLYPAMKRITYLPQVFLGLTFNLGSLIAYGTIRDYVDIKALILYLGCCFWTIGYDTIYAFMDIKDDKKVGIKSLAILLEHKNYQLWIGLCYSLFLSSIIIISVSSQNYSMPSAVTIILAASNLLWQIISLDIYDPAKCSKLFKQNNIVGLLLATTLMLIYTVN